MRTRRVLAWAVMLFVGTSCGESADSHAWKPGDPESRAIPSANLTHAGFVADAPLDAVTVGIAADGTLYLGGKQGGLGMLREGLIARTRDPIQRNPDGSSKLNLVVRVDRRAPWELVTWVMQIVSDPQIDMDRFHFAVAPEAGGEDGVIEAFFPKKGSFRPFTALERAPIRMNLQAHEGAPDRGAVFAAIRVLMAAGPRAVELSLSRTRPLRVGPVLTVFDLALRAGAITVSLGGTASPMPLARAAWDLGPAERASTDAADASSPGSLPWLRAWVVRWSKENPEGYEVRIGSAAFTPTSDGASVPLPPPPPRRTRRLPTEVVTEYHYVPEDVDQSAGPFPARGRSQEAREILTPEADAAVEAALKWLAAHQSVDGGWLAEGFGEWCDRKPATQGTDGAGLATYDVGVTGLALVAFLGAGYTNRSQGPFGKVIGDGLRYLRNNQDAEGCFGGREQPRYVYNHALASLAMVEAYGMTRSPINKNATQKALDFIASARNPKLAWRYGVRPGDNDTSVTGLMALVLSSARLVNGADAASGRPASLVLDEVALAGAAQWLDEMTDAKTGRVGYQIRGTGSARPADLVDKFPADRTEAMTAMGVLLRTTLGEDPATSDPIRQGVTLMGARPPIWNASDGSLDFYYWHAASLAMFQVGGEAWSDWWAAIHAAVLPHQRTDGDPCGVKGSWDPLDAWGRDGGRVYATALLACTLETPMRYARRFLEPK